jgi:hypothetical protein
MDMWFTFPSKEVTMSKNSLRIEKASPAMASGAFGVGLFGGAANGKPQKPHPTDSHPQSTRIQANAPVIRLTQR